MRRVAFVCRVRVFNCYKHTQIFCTQSVCYITVEEDDIKINRVVMKCKTKGRSKQGSAAEFYGTDDTARGMST
jgi:hypothetical protein